MGWYGVDLDGTLAHYDGWEGIESIGAPVPAMAERVKGWLAEGRDVRIVTARVAGAGTQEALWHIQKWCEQHFGVVLPVTCEKDFGMLELWDDRVVQVEPNTGRAIQDDLASAREALRLLEPLVPRHAFVEALTAAVGHKAG